MGSRFVHHEGSAPAKPYEPNGLLRWLYRRFFRHVDVDDRWHPVVRDAAQRGVVVYAMRSLSLLDFLCLDYLVKRFGLPLIRFVNDLGLWILEPFGRGQRRLRLRRQTPEDEALNNVIQSRFSALLFLQRPSRYRRASRRGQKLQTDLIRTLVSTQRRIEEPILLVPQTFVWTKRSPKAKPGFVDLLFGSVEWPGRIRAFFQFLLNYRRAQLRSGEPFDLQRFVDEHQDLTDAQVADKLRYALLRRMERERALVLGPAKKPPARIEEELLRSPRVRKQLETRAKRENKPIGKMERYARKELRRMAANQSPVVLGVLQRFLHWLWHRLYDGIVVDEEGIERVRDAARQGTVVFVPSHRSHVDYLVLSYVLDAHAMSPPLIAAGDNLAFWPLGPVLRRGGAFFIRRSFQGRKLYAALVDAYLRKLLVSGYPLEFFIEGGRSRTGKLAAPRYGLLSMVVDAALLLRHRKIQIVPVNISYERVIEEHSYVHELDGGDKKRENFGELLKTPAVLRSKYGRLYVQFGAIFELGQTMRDELGQHGELPDKPSPPQRRALVQHLAHRIVDEIERVAMVTPAALVATALLSHRRRGMTHAELLRSSSALLEALEAMGAPLAGHLRDEQGTLRDDVIAETVALFRDGKLVIQHDTGHEPIYTLPDERRIALEYYKNTILHFFVPSALVCAALHVDDRKPVSLPTLRQRGHELFQLFKHELAYRSDDSFDSLFDEATSRMLHRGELEQTADHVRPADGEPGSMTHLYAETMRTYFESHLVATRAAASVVAEPMARKDWIKHALPLGRRMYLAGVVELRESVSKPKLENALRALQEYGLVRVGDGDMLMPGEAGTDERAFETVERRLMRFAR